MIFLLGAPFQRLYSRKKKFKIDRFKFAAIFDLTAAGSESYIFCILERFFGSGINFFIVRRNNSVNRYAAFRGSHANRNIQQLAHLPVHFFRTFKIYSFIRSLICQILNGNNSLVVYICHIQCAVEKAYSIIRIILII